MGIEETVSEAVRRAVREFPHDDKARSPSGPNMQAARPVEVHERHRWT